MSGPDFRDTTVARELLRPAFLAGDLVDPGPVLDALDQAARTTDAAQAVTAAEVLRNGIRRFLGERSWLMSDAELLSALWGEKRPGVDPTSYEES